ncbi:hypothetical protein Aduo_013500 [Ancylostoma duodenale]
MVGTVKESRRQLAAFLAYAHGGVTRCGFDETSKPSMVERVNLRTIMDDNLYDTYLGLGLYWFSIILPRI